MGNAAKKTPKTTVKEAKKTTQRSRSTTGSSTRKPRAKTSVGGGSGEIKETTNNGLEKAIIALGKHIDRSSKNIDRLGATIDIAILSMTTSIAESDAKIAASDAKIAASDAKIAASDAKIAEANASMAASFAKLDRVVEGTKAELAGLSESSGRAVESMAFNFFVKRMTFAGVPFDDIECGITRIKKLPDGKRVQGEYDVILYNGTAIALVEVKNRVRMEDLDKLINEQMPRFKQFFPQYKDFKYYLGLCGMSFEEGVEETALGRGIGTLKPSGDALEINETNVKAW